MRTVSFVEFLVVMVTALLALLIVQLIVISLLSKDNPLCQIMIALAKPIGVAVVISIFGIPVAYIPGIETIYDIGGLIIIVNSWIKFASEARLIWPDVARYFSDRRD